MFLFSCEKQDSSCWRCETAQITQYTIGYVKGRAWASINPGDTIWINPDNSDWLKDFYPNPLILEYCDATKEEIAEIETKGTFVHNLFGIWWHQTTTCKLK